MTIVNIAGMHRSGTSMITRLLNLCGVYLGDQSNLLPPDPDNTEGYWEHRQFVLLNDELLSELGGGWDYPPNVDEGWETSPELSHFRSRASELVQNFSAHRQWGWKDPRNSLTYPFWKQLLPSMKVVICLRNPQEVVDSLIKRNYFSPTLAFNLWLEYNKRIMSYIEPENRIITHYDSYFQDPYSELSRILKFLDMNVSEKQLIASIQAVSIPLRHNQSTLENLIINSSSEVIHLYQKMCAETGKVLQLSPELNQIQVPFVNKTRGTHDQKNVVEFSSLELIQKNKWIIKQEKTIQELTAQVAVKDQSIHALTTQIAKREHHLAEIRNSKAWKFAMLFQRIGVAFDLPNRRAIQVLGRFAHILMLPFITIKRNKRIQEDLALIRSSDLFDEAWYLTNNPDLVKGKVNPLLHYLHHGGFEGRASGPNFSSKWYLDTYQDVKKVGVNPLVHYLKYGKSEGRKAQPEVVLQVSRNPIIIHQMGKVGSKTVERSLLDAYKALGIEVPIYHIHMLNNFNQLKQHVLEAQPNSQEALATIKNGENLRQMIDGNLTQDWNIITLVSDPIARAIATLFENLPEYIPDWRERYTNGKLSIDELQELLFTINPPSAEHLAWFDQQVKQISAFGIDIYAEPFPKEIGYKIYSGASRARLLLIRAENLDKCAERAIHEFLGLEHFTLRNSNIGDENDHADLYRAFKNQPLPIAYVQRIYNTPVVHYFYTEAELLAFAKHWARIDKIELARSVQYP